MTWCPRVSWVWEVEQDHGSMGMRRTGIWQSLGQVLSSPVRACGGISLKVSPSFPYALIRGWLHAKTPVGLGHRAGRWEEGRRWMCRRWCWLFLVATAQFGTTVTGSHAGKEALRWGCLSSKLKADTRRCLHLLSR